MNVSLAEKTEPKIKEPQKLSPRISWLRNYYFEGCKRNWNNENTAWSTGTPWDLFIDLLAASRSSGVDPDIDWVYNSMPPSHGQIYPESKLEPITDF